MDTTGVKQFNHLRIVFLGTSDFAVACLKILVTHQANVVAVVTAPDRPKGRGKKVGTSAVKEYAIATKIPVLQPVNLKSAAFLTELKGYAADLQVVVAFRMLPASVWAMPRLGTFNLHPSLLPQYRGAAPIHRAIIAGEKETGVTTFFLKHEIDTGAIIFQEKEAIHDTDNAGMLYERLMTKGAELVLKTVRAIATGNYPNVPQQAKGHVPLAPKIFKEDCRIDWTRSVTEVRNFVRGLSPYPTAWTTFEGKIMKVFEVEESTSATEGPIGQIRISTGLKVNVATGTLSLLDVQIEGKKRMKTADFLRGYQPAKKK